MCCSPWGHKESDTTERLNRLASPNISVITLSESELNTLTKRHRVATWIKKKKKTQLYEKRWAGRSKSWNQDCREIYQ